MLNRLLKLKGRVILPDPPVTARPVTDETAAEVAWLREQNAPPRHLTEAEYAAWIERSAKERCDRLNEQFGDLLPDGVRFEWAPADQPPAD
jgi:hypothetical protein